MITIISVGKLSKDYNTICQSYLKKIAFFTKLNIIELKEMNHKNILLQKQKETENILKVIPKNNQVFLCSIQGKELSSKEFSTFFAQHSKVTFIIGGSHGVQEKLLNNLQVDKISFSQMTFAHQLFKVMLVEQIFRGLSILGNLKYHK